MPQEKNKTPIAKNFERWELECPCCRKFSMAPETVQAMQSLRDKIDMPLTITSGYRCRQHNIDVGGAKSSRHMTGQAFDCYSDLPLYYLAQIAINMPEFHSHGGIGVYPKWRDEYGRIRGNFLHLDTRQSQARWGRYQGIKIPFYAALKIARDQAEDEEDLKNGLQQISSS